MRSVPATLHTATKPPPPAGSRPSATPSRARPTGLCAAGRAARRRGVRRLRGRAAEAGRRDRCAGAGRDPAFAEVCDARHARATSRTRWKHQGDDSRARVEGGVSARVVSPVPRRWDIARTAERQGARGSDACASPLPPSTRGAEHGGLRPPATPARPRCGWQAPPQNTSPTGTCSARRATSPSSAGSAPTSGPRRPAPSRALRSCRKHPTLTLRRADLVAARACASGSASSTDLRPAWRRPRAPRASRRRVAP